MEWIKRLLNKRKNNASNSTETNITVRQGASTDTTWIISLLKEGAHDMHYLPTVAVQAPAVLDTIFKNGGITMMKLRDRIHAPRFIQASILVAEYEGVPASFLINLTDGNEVELHLAGTTKQYRRNGCFNQLIRHTIENHNENIKIYARCYKKSTWAIAGLKKEGFVITKDGDPVELSLSRLK